MRLWSFACELYSKPGVEPALLTLQNDHGLVINHLLYAAWLVAEERTWDWKKLLLSEQSTGLLTDVIEPTRDFRMHAKGQVTDHLYQALKTLELDLEKQHLEWLEQQSTSTHSLPSLAISNGLHDGLSVGLSYAVSDEASRQNETSKSLTACLNAYLVASASLAEDSADEHVSGASTVSADLNAFITLVLS